MKLQILLATYNSEKFLRQQIDSILSQDYQDFQLLIRDAGSTDSTMQIISDYTRRYPEKICFTEQGKADACQNFFRLMELSDADILMFSDHDDVWLTDKISRTVKSYQQNENKYGRNCPILVFTDSKVTDENLNILNPSMFACQHLNAVDCSFAKLVVQNTASGNTMLINRALKELVLPPPHNAVMHDHYLMLAASAFGKIILLNEPTLLYRQHGKNVLGAVNYSIPYFLQKLLGGRKEIVERFNRNIIQAEEFYHINKEKLSAETAEFLLELSTFRKMNFIAKRSFLLRKKMFKSGLLRNVGMFLLI